MREDIEKVLIFLGRMAIQIPAVQVIVGYLLADPGRVRFVRAVREDHPLAMAISVHRRIEIPLVPWQGYIRGVPVPDPISWIQASRGLKGSEVAVRISTDDVTLVQLLTPLLAKESPEENRAAVEGRMNRLRTELDRVLDLYNEVRHLMEVDQERQAELEKFLAMAESEMKTMGQELKTLKKRLQGESS